ncbi:MAG: hypothetical protein SGPRY_002555, partial [Prymnesium sp.]
VEGGSDVVERAHPEGVTGKRPFEAVREVVEMRPEMMEAVKDVPLYHTLIVRCRCRRRCRG